jgi:hypothetical protein
MAPQRGRASTISGSSHSTYCWDQTLLKIRNAATTRNATWASRGRRGASRQSAAMAAQARKNSAYDRTLSVGMLSLSHWNGPRSPGAPLFHLPSRKRPMYQSVPQSIGRSVLSSKNRIQLSRYSTNTGAFTTTQVTTAAPIAYHHSRIRRDRRQSISSGPSTNSGQSFAAPPSPSRTPASTGWRFDQAYTPDTASAMARKSQFTVAVTNRMGDTAKIAASQGRRRRSARITATVATARADSTSALAS